MQKCWGKSKVRIMKKAISVLTCLLFMLTIINPVGTILSACFGYTFEIISVPAFAVIIEALSVCAVVFDLVFKNPIENKVIQVLLAIVPPLPLFNAVLFILECRRIWVVTSILISAGCCCFLAVKHGKPFAIKIAALALSSVLILPIGFFSFMTLFFGDIGQNTVVQTVESPSGQYYAQVIESDQGALGGDTLVDVYENSEINALFFKFEKMPQRVYFGDWGEFENMQIYWKDDGCLVINSVEYEVE